VRASHVDQGKKAEMQSTLKHKSKTHLEMLPQSPALKVSVDAPGKVKPGTIEIGSPMADQTGVQHARGERPAAAGPSPFSQGKEQRGVTRVFVLSKDGSPLMPCHAARARELLTKGKAVVERRYPFVIRLKHNPNEPKTQPAAIKLDPGAKTTGIAIVRVTPTTHYVLHLSELTHRGTYIKESLAQRRAFRRNRRNRKTRYRAPGFDNRTRPDGWLPPSLQSRVDNVLSWVGRYRRWTPITQIVVETVRFDTQLLVNPEINGIEYQRGTLYGYELREYLLEKWGRKCAYCDAQNVPLEVEHIQPKGRRGSDRISNLTLACHGCNHAKGSQPVEIFIGNDPERLKRIKYQLQTSLTDTAAVNATRTKILRELFKTDLSVEVSTGGKTKFNRCRFNVPKTHALDAACTGNTPGLQHWNIPVLAIKAGGRGSYQRTNLDSFGFPRGCLMRQKKVKGFQTGDIVCAVVPKGKRIGKHFGRVAIRARGSFNIQTSSGIVSDINHKYCRLIQRTDGYSYQPRNAAISTVS
jgi:5-methylcytosine-specific restriction endonuclease McrA